MKFTFEDFINHYLELGRVPTDIEFLQFCKQYFNKEDLILGRSGYTILYSKSNPLSTSEIATIKTMEKKLNTIKFLSDNPQNKSRPDLISLTGYYLRSTHYPELNANEMAINILNELKTNYLSKFKQSFRMEKRQLWLTYAALDCSWPSILNNGHIIAVNKDDEEYLYGLQLEYFNGSPVVTEAIVPKSNYLGYVWY